MMTGKWYRIRDMIHQREYASCVAMDCKIYITCGGVNSMEVYDIGSNSYSLASITFPYKYAVSAIIDDRIYVINSNHYKFISKELEIIEEGNYTGYVEHTKTLGNVVVNTGCICYYNEESHGYEIMNTKINIASRYYKTQYIHNKFFMT